MWSGRCGPLADWTSPGRRLEAAPPSPLHVILAPRRCQGFSREGGNAAAAHRLPIAETIDSWGGGQDEAITGWDLKIVSEALQLLKPTGWVSTVLIHILIDFTSEAVEAELMRTTGVVPEVRLLYSTFCTSFLLMTA